MPLPVWTGQVCVCPGWEREKQLLADEFGNLCGVLVAFAINSPLAMVLTFPLQFSLLSTTVCGIVGASTGRLSTLCSMHSMVVPPAGALQMRQMCKEGFCIVALNFALGEAFAGYGNCLKHSLDRFEALAH